MSAHDAAVGAALSLANLPPLPDRPLVSVVIPALNEERYIGACLESLERQTYDHGRIEVIVADGGSEDRTRDIVSEFARRSTLRAVRLVDNPRRRAPHGLNAGVAVANGEVIIILGAHSEAAPDFVEQNVNVLRETNAAAVGGPLVTKAHGRIGPAIAAAMSHPFGVGDARFRWSTRPGPVDTIAFAAYRRACFERLGGFPDIEKGVDDAFNYLVRSAGGVLYLDPRIRSVYYARMSLPALWRQYFGYGKARGRLLRRAPRSVRWRHLVPLAALVAGAAAGSAALVSLPARRLLAGLAGTYLLLDAAAAAHASRERPWLAPLVALTFPTMHAAYGLGEAVGFLHALVTPPTPDDAPRPGAAAPASAFDS